MANEQKIVEINKHYQRLSEDPRYAYFFKDLENAELDDQKIEDSSPKFLGLSGYEDGKFIELEGRLRFPLLKNDGKMMILYDFDSIINSIWELIESICKNRIEIVNLDELKTVQLSLNGKTIAESVSLIEINSSKGMKQCLLETLESSLERMIKDIDSLQKLMMNNEISDMIRSKFQDKINVIEFMGVELPHA